VFGRTQRAVAPARVLLYVPDGGKIARQDERYSFKLDGA
jgi:hypothetical protein